MAAKKRGKGGRPRSVMTEQVCDSILRSVREGMWPDQAARREGISPATMRAHKKRNPEFATDIEKAEAHAEQHVTSKIVRHMDKQWTACAWMLERRWPERWAKREYVTHDDKREPDPRFE